MKRQPGFERVQAIVNFVRMRDGLKIVLEQYCILNSFQDRAGGKEPEESLVCGIRHWSSCNGFPRIYETNSIPDSVFSLPDRLIKIHLYMG